MVDERQDTTETSQPRIEAIRALYNSNFRLFWFGLIISNIGSWVQTVAQGWLVYRLTNSSFYLGLVGFSSSLPLLLFLLIGGAIADRINKRKLIYYTQTISLLNALILGILVSTGWVHIWHVIVLSFISGTVLAFDGPGRQAFVQDLVEGTDVINAVALNSAVFNGARILGPALAGVLIASVGIASCFYINAISFVAVDIALFLMKDNLKSAAVEASSSVWADLKEGLVFIKGQPTIIMLIIMAGVPAICIIPYTTLMPACAREVFKGGPQTYGILLSAVGIGALIGALGLAATSSYPNRGKILLSAGLIGSSALTLFTFCRHLEIALLTLPFVGMSITAYAATTSSTLQIIVPPNIRGRVLSAYMMAFMGMAPVGNLAAGAVAHALGVQMALRIGALACGFFIINVAFFKKDIRNLKV